VAFLGAVQDSHADRSVLQVYPNPSNGIFNLELTPEGSEKINTIEIFNSLGLLVFKSLYPETMIDLSSFPEGLYLVRVETSSGILTQRLLLYK
jgi:hypothetical protein